MAETASQTITINAAPERVWEIAVDFERYPEWAKDVKDVIVRTKPVAGPASPETVRILKEQADLVLVGSAD